MVIQKNSPALRSLSLLSPVALRARGPMQRVTAPHASCKWHMTVASQKHKCCLRYLVLVDVHSSTGRSTSTQTH